MQMIVREANMECVLILQKTGRHAEDECFPLEKNAATKEKLSKERKEARNRCYSKKRVGWAGDMEGNNETADKGIEIK